MIIFRKNEADVKIYFIQRVCHSGFGERICENMSDCRQNNRAVGARYEQKAAELLRQEGYQILVKNYRCRRGEIDLIAREGMYLVFIEVKYRVNSTSGYGMEAVDYRKQNRIIRAAQWYLMEEHVEPEQPCRFDVVSFLGDEMTLIKDAFQC